MIHDKYKKYKKIIIIFFLSSPIFKNAAAAASGGYGQEIASQLFIYGPKAYIQPKWVK